MPLFESKQERAALLILVLCVGLLIALAPYATGLIGVPVLYVVFEPVHAWLRRHVGDTTAATLVIVFVVFLIVVPGASFAGLVVRQARNVGSDVLQNPLLSRLSTLTIGNVNVGAQVADMGNKAVSWIGSGALGLIGSATRALMNLVVSLFGLFYLLLRPTEVWGAVQLYIPFTARNTEKLRKRFQDVTTSTIIGTGLTAVIQGLLLGLGFWVLGLPEAVFWSVVTMVASILPVVGSGLIWGPATVILLLDHRYPAALAMALWGVIVVGNVDFVIRPMVFRRWAQIHPLITLVGALAGLPYFGLLGLLIGPLALSYVFELLKMYHEEYLA